jgi:hypothetical protein
MASAAPVVYARTAMIPISAAIKVIAIRSFPLVMNPPVSGLEILHTGRDAVKEIHNPSELHSLDGYNGSGLSWKGF